MADLLSSGQPMLGILVLKKAMEVRKQNSEDLFGILKKINPAHLGNNVDICM